MRKPLIILGFLAASLGLASGAYAVGATQGADIDFVNKNSMDANGTEHPIQFYLLVNGQFMSPITQYITKDNGTSFHRPQLGFNPKYFDVYVRDVTINPAQWIPCARGISYPQSGVIRIDGLANQNVGSCRVSFGG